MALAAASVFEVRTAGLDTNGGGFVTGAAGTDYSQQDSKNVAGADISTTDAVAVGSTTLTSVTANFGTTIVGNIIYLQGGTGALAAGWYQVTARASTTSITLDRTVAAGTGITMNIGGALGSPGMVGGVGIVFGNMVHVKAGTYTITSATPNISGGCFQSSLNLFIMHGYQTVREDYGTQPLFQASGIATFILVSNTGDDSSVSNIAVDGAGLASSRGISAQGVVFKCIASNCTNSGFIMSSIATFSRCIATGCSTQPAFSNGSCYNCVAYDNTITGFSNVSSNSTYSRCISDSNSGATTDGFITNVTVRYINCVAYNNGRDGFRIDDDNCFTSNCIAESNGANGIILNGAMDSNLLVNNATFGNVTTGIALGTGKGVINMSPVVGTSTFFTNAAGQDFSLNNVAGGGAAARATGYPGALPVGGTGYLDIGALQSQAAASTGGPPYIIGG